MNRTYVLYDEDIQAGCNVEYMSEECAAAENEQLEEKGESVRWIPYEDYMVRAEQRSRAYRELHSSVIKRLIAEHSK